MYPLQIQQIWRAVMVVPLAVSSLELVDVYVSSKGKVESQTIT